MLSQQSVSRELVPRMSGQSTHESTRLDTEIARLFTIAYDVRHKGYPASADAIAQAANDLRAATKERDRRLGRL